MAVFTELTLKNAQIICQRYNLAINAITPIVEGVTNSNYLISAADNKKYVLTIIEQINLTQLPEMMDMLVSLPHTVPHPHILATSSNNHFETFNNKPVTICKFVDGAYPQTPSITQIETVAKAMAHLHCHQAPSFKRVNPRGLDWMQKTAEKVLPKLAADEQSLLKNTLTTVAKIDFTQLPKGIIHCDLFRDNTLFVDDKLNAIIDFYYACHDCFLFDIAISINDWCFDEPEIFINAYQTVRQLTDIEVNSLNTMRQLACLRFWLSRLYDLHFPVDKAHTLVKDPREMRDKLEQLNN